MRIRPDSVFFIILLSALGGLTPLSIDMGLPALQAIAHSLQVSPAASALTLSFFLVGFAFGPVVLGPLSDRFGRRPVLLAGCGLFAMTGIGCALATSLPILLLWRLIEGIGAGAGSTLSLGHRARSHSMVPPARARLSYVATVGSIAPMIAPTPRRHRPRVGWLRGHLRFSRHGGRAPFRSSPLRLRGIASEDRSHRAPARAPGFELRPHLRNRICPRLHARRRAQLRCMFSYIASSPLVMMGVLGISRRPPTAGPSPRPRSASCRALSRMAGSTRAASRHDVAQYRPRSFFDIRVGSARHFLFESCLRRDHPAAARVNTFSVGFIGPNATQGRDCIDA